MRKILALVMSVVMAFSLVACGGNDDADTNNDVATDGSVALSVCLASEPDNIDPALNATADGATMLAHLFSGLAKWSQDENGNLVIIADAAEELVDGVVNEDGTVTYTYTLKDGLTWSDGQPVTANDFAFAWNRAANVKTGSGYAYLFDVIDGYSEKDEAAQLNVKAIDEKTLEVTLTNVVSYWNELLAFPTYFPVREDVAENDTWATDPSTYISNGAYKMTAWDHNSVITVTKNEDYYDAENVTVDEINFFLSDDDNNMLTNFKNGDWQLIDSVPNNEIPNLKVDYEGEFNIVGQIGTYYVCWNVNESILPESSTLTGVEAEAAEEEIRKAISLIFDRNYIVENVSQAGEVPASSFVAMGMTNPDGTEFYQTAGTSEDYYGYYNVDAEAFADNYNFAIETLKKYYTYDGATSKFTDAPSLTYLYNTADNHKAIGEYLAGALDSIGITMNLVNQEWNTFLNTRKEGDYTIARNGWVADYNDPICFLDMWVTTSGNNDVQYGKGEHAELKMYDLDLTALGSDIKVEDGTWAETYDVLIDEIKACTDDETRYAMMHIAEDMLMETGAITPIYFNTDIYMLDDSVEGFYSNPLGYKYFMHCTVK